MQQNEKSNGSLRERWTERLAGRIAGAASAEEMRMWPLMLRTLALNLRAGIPLHEAVHTDTGSRQLGENELVPDTGKTRVKNSSRKSARKNARALRTRGFSPLSEDYGHKRCAEDIRRFTQALAALASWGAPAHLACAQLLENSSRMRPHSRDRLYDLQLSLRMSESAGAPLATSLERAAEHAEERFAGRRWTAALVHRAEVESTRAGHTGGEQALNAPTVDTALVLELLAAQLRAGLAPLAALGTLAEALNSRPLYTVCQRLQMGSSWGSAWSGSAAGTFGELRDALAPAYTGGAPSTALLLSLADAHRLSERRAAERAAGKLSVALVVPLGLCSLPAFICLGIVPIIISLLPTLTG